MEFIPRRRIAMPGKRWSSKRRAKNIRMGWASTIDKNGGLGLSNCDPKGDRRAACEPTCFGSCAPGQRDSGPL